MSEHEHSDLEREALELPRAIETPRDLWAGIEARIEARRGRAMIVRRRMTGGAVVLAAAGVLLSIGFAKRPPVANRMPPPITSEAPPVVAPPTASAEPTLDGVVPEEESYLAALSSLQSTLVEREKELPAQDVAAVGVSLRAIDAAIAVTRASLVERPGDADLRGELDAEYEQKIDAMNDVLEWTTRS